MLELSASPSSTAAAARESRAVAGADLGVGRGRIAGLVGESGCGKSTLARAAVGLERWRRARSSSTAAMSPPRPAARPRRPARLQLVFQNPYSSLNPRRRVGDHIADGARLLRGASRNDGLRGARAAASSWGCRPTPSSATRTSSRAASGSASPSPGRSPTRPSCLIADEPSPRSTPRRRLSSRTCSSKLSRELNLGLVLISHDLAIVRHVADRSRSCTWA